MTGVEFPAMRREVARALASLADEDYQNRAWIRHEFDNPKTFDDLSLNVHILYDDSEVLPDPSSRIGTVLLDGDEIGALAALGTAMEGLLDRLGESPDSDYLASDEWPEVVRASRVALAAMVRGGGCL